MVNHKHVTPIRGSCTVAQKDVTPICARDWESTCHIRDLKIADNHSATQHTDNNVKFVSQDRNNKRAISCKVSDGEHKEIEALCCRDAKDLPLQRVGDKMRMKSTSSGHQAQREAGWPAIHLTTGHTKWRRASHIRRQALPWEDTAATCLMEESRRHWRVDH